MSRLDASIAELKRNRRQWQAFNVRSHSVVLAPPGSGKTKLLTTRLAFDLANSIPPPQGAACITLTNAAAGELRRRVEVLGVERRSTLFVGTVHSFARRRIIEPYAKASGKPWLAALGIATKTQCSRVLAEATVKIFGHGGDLRFVDSTVGVARQRLTKGAGWNQFGDRIQAVSRLYEETLLSRGLCDFTGLVAYAVEMVEESAALRNILSTIYPNLYVDEYQDLAPGLDRIVRSLCLSFDAKTTLFAVGDPDQAVYAFTGTRPELLDELTRYPQVTTTELNQNYRSGQTLIDIAGRMRPAKSPVIGVRGGGEAWTLRCPSGFEQQIFESVRLVREALSAGLAPTQVAVICPWNQHCEQVAHTLRAAGIRSSVRENLYRSTTSTLFVEACATWAVANREVSGYTLSNVLSSWRQLLGHEWTRRHDVELTRILLSSRTAGNMPMTSFFQQLVTLGLYCVQVSSAASEDTIELNQMWDALSTGKLAKLTLAQFVDRIQRANCVEVLNMTVCKGLEFDRVIVIGLDDEMVPHYKSLQGNSDQLAEDRRKFYVALTRAREEIFLLYSGFVEAPWGRKMTAPSLFMREIGII